MVTKLPDYAFLYVLELNNGFIIAWGFVNGFSVYSVQQVTLPITYTSEYKTFGSIAWTAQNNIWYTDNNPASACALTDICGSNGYTDRTNSYFYISSFSNHIYMTIGY